MNSLLVTMETERPAKKTKDERGNRNKSGRETPHCKQGTRRAGVHLPFKEVFSLELNNCRPFLWLSPPLENNPDSERFRPFVSRFPRLCSVTARSPPACITIQGARPGLIHVTPASRGSLAAARTPPALPSPPSGRVKKPNHRLL